MDHGRGDGGGWSMWLPMILCCAVMLVAIVALGGGVWSLR